MSTDIAALWDALRTGNVREVAKQIQPEFGPCDICGERPGARFATESRICVCEECDEDERAEMLGRRRPHRTWEERDADEFGVRSRGEI